MQWFPSRKHAPEPAASPDHAQAQAQAQAVQAVRDARTRKATRDEGEAIPAAYQAFHERLRAEREAGVF